MAFIGSLLSIADQVGSPSNFFELIWSWFLLVGFAFIASYGWRVVVFTLILKLITSPLDIYQRIAMRKNQKITESLKPEIEKLEKVYGENPQVLQKKKQELNKKNGVKMAAGCLPMLITLVISMWLLMGGLNPISQYQNTVQYLHVFDAFTNAERVGQIQLAREDENQRYFVFKNINGEEIDTADITGSTKIYGQDYFTVFDTDGTTKMTDINRITDIAASGASRIIRDIAYIIVECKEDCLDNNCSACKFYKVEISDGADLTDEQKALMIFSAELKQWQDLVPFTTDSRWANFVVNDPSLTEQENINATAKSISNELQSQSARISTPLAQAVASAMYEEKREDFLWVKNIWVADVFWRAPINDYSGFVTAGGAFAQNPDRLGLTAADFGLPETASDEEVAEHFRTQIIGQYDRVMAHLFESPENRVNGYLILPILAMGIMIVSQILTRRLQKKSGQGAMPGMGMGMPGMPGGGGGGAMSKFMPYLMPIMFGAFALMYTAAFSLYIITNSLIMVIITLTSSLIIHLIDKKSKKETVTEEGVMKIGRADPNEKKAKPESIKTNNSNNSNKNNKKKRR